MKHTFATALLAGGIVLLTTGTALVAALPSPRSTTTTIADRSTTLEPTTKPRDSAPSSSIPPITRSARGSTAPSTTEPVSSPPTTLAVISTITYAVKPADTISKIERWFEQHGYGLEFTANLLVIESNKQLLVPGALVSITDGVMTIQSPA
jgi:hypothetical protein